MPEGDLQHDALDALAAEFVERRRRGEWVSISEYAAKYPDLADDIRDLFPTIATVERLKASRGRSDDGRASLGPDSLQRLGDYRIVREVGRGGMGVVYEAEQESLGRAVAVKVLPRQSLLEPKHLVRFRREARIAAGLHHTNIVQVYGVGEHEGFHYYAMQLVRGVGLDRIISRRAAARGTKPADRPGQPPRGEAPAGPSDEQVDRIAARLLGDDPGEGPPPAECWLGVARVGMQVAEALHYAHAQGALHRDIKPANLLVDEQALVWVTDFGLARAAQSQDVTQEGGVTGTLRYMAPEQFHGLCDGRSDIYGLGVTLYELAALRPAYDETDQGRLIGLIAREDPPRLRKVNPHVPRDLETIILKAVARDPERRYPSPDALAADLQRFVEDRPIEARRVGAGERLWRWCRRNPAVATLAAAVWALVVLVAAVAMVGYARTSGALAREADQRRRAEATADLGMEALDRIFERFSPGAGAGLTRLTLEGNQTLSVEVGNPPVLSREAAALLEEMLPFYDRLAGQVANDVGVREKIAAANRRVGDVRQRLGQYDRAAEAYRRAIDAYRNLSAAARSNEQYSTEIARIENELGLLYRSTRRPVEARQSHERALTILQSMPPETADSPPVRYELARTCYYLGTRPQPEPGIGPGGPGAGPPPPRDEQPGRRQPRPGGEDRPRPPGQRREENPFLSRAVNLLDDLVREQPDDAGYRFLLALCLRESPRRGSPRTEGPPADGLSRATAILEQLVHDFPAVADYRYELSETYSAADPHGPLPPGEADTTVEDRLRKALGLSEKLVAENPYVPQYAASQARMLHKFSGMLRRARRIEEAEETCRRAVGLYAGLVAEFPTVSPYKVWLGALRNSLGEIVLDRGRPQDARSLLAVNVEMLDTLLEAEPSLWSLHGLLDQSHSILAETFRREGEQTLAVEHAARAQAHRRSLHLARPGAPSGPEPPPRAPG